MDYKSLGIVINTDKCSGGCCPHTMNNIEESTYIYVIGQHPNNILRFDLPIKIGYSETLDNRLNKFDGEQFCIKPKIIRIFECIKKKHNKPDHVYHKIFNELIQDSDIEMIDIKKELFKVDNLEMVDKVMTFFSDINPKNRYYKDPNEIQELVERKSIINEVINNLVNCVISENEDVVSDNSDNTEVQSIGIPDNINDLLINLVKTAYNPNENKQSLKKYISKTYILTIINHIPDTYQFVRISENPNENKEEIMKILNRTYELLKIDEDKKIIGLFPKCILNIIKKNYE